MVVCKYFLAGRCRYGDNCKYEHPPQANGRNNSNDPFNTSSKRNENHSARNIEDNPQWPLSVIGMKEALERGNALAGDLSQEELRVMAYSMAPKGMSSEVNDQESRVVSERRAKADLIERANMPSHIASASNLQDPFANTLAQNGAHNNSFNQQASQHNDPFGSNAPNSDPFGTQSTNVDPFGQSSNPFDQSQAPIMPTQEPSAPISDAAREQFNASQFTYGKIPETAPTPPFC